MDELIRLVLAHPLPPSSGPEAYMIVKRCQYCYCLVDVQDMWAHEHWHTSLDDDIILAQQEE